ncbi:hypothetical protein [Arthrobacter sp. Cr_A7]|uniref:hypothetical protein n=1 Tax=Arthrobacter sp. Cr_A7 TaxID=3031017 RepID=UPI0023D9AD44|nr:hypothetical protein [Arthrobacter sp. Cr_A7]MDF2051052.1 hypothetical protein [Arthrobacter sp. Cr_A7]
MHTSFQLERGLFDVRLSGASVDFEQLFPDWGSHDRVAVLVDKPFGVLGASLYVQAAITRYFDYRRDNYSDFERLLEMDGERKAVDEADLELKGKPGDPLAMAERGQVPYPEYAEIYALHIGQLRGDHTGMDVTPTHRERVVNRNFRAITEALADLAITRLVIPDSVPESAAVAWEVRAVLRERIRSVLIYDASGKVHDPNIEIRGTSSVVEQNPDVVLNWQPTIERLEVFLQTVDSSYVRRGVARMKERQPEVSEETRRRLVKERAESLIDGLRVETYRSVSLQQGLDTIAGLVS